MSNPARSSWLAIVGDKDNENIKAGTLDGVLSITESSVTASWRSRRHPATADRG